MGLSGICNWNVKEVLKIMFVLPNYKPDGIEVKKM